MKNLTLEQVQMSCVKDDLRPVLMAEGVRRLGAPRAAVVSTVGPPTTIVLGALLLGDALQHSEA